MVEEQKVNSILLALFCLFLPNPGLEIDGPETLAVAEYGDYAIRGLTLDQAKTAYVDVWPEAGTTIRPVLTWSGEPLLLFRARAPGQYRLLVAVPVSADRLIVAKKVIQVGTPQPEPKPDPGPQPDPQPKPYRELWMLVVEERLDRTPQTAAIVLAPELRRLLSDRVRLLDKDVLDRSDQVPGWAKKWLELAKGKRLPYLFLFTEHGEVLWEGQLPKTLAEVRALIEQRLPKQAAVTPSTAPGASIWRSVPQRVCTPYGCAP
jgi:hypothetical protein